MPDRARGRKALLRITPLVGIGLLGYLLTTVRLNILVVNARAIGWGLLLVIALGGLSHVIKTWAWRFALRGEACKVSFGRTLSLRLISEAIGQFGVVGMLGGEAARVSLLGSGVSTAGALSSVALDRTLFILAGAVVTIAGVVGLLFAVSVSHATHIYATVLVAGLLIFLFTGAIAIQRRWPVFSGPTGAVARIPWFRRWLQSKEETMKVAEQRIVNYYHEAPGAFWFSGFLNLFCHFLAILEVYIIIRMLGAPATLLGALILESLTKLINVAGSINPGNVGTYEGGNMVIGRLVSMTGAQGLLLALCRRLRGVFWAIIGGICLLWISKKQKPDAVLRVPNTVDRAATEPVENSRHTLSARTVAIILAHDLHSGEFEPALAQVATLPVILRAILGVYKECIRTIVVSNPDAGPKIRRELVATGRLPGDIEWMEAAADSTLSSILVGASVSADKVAFVRGNCSYRPSLFRLLHEWNGGEADALELLSSGEPIGLSVLDGELAADLAAECDFRIVNERSLHHWLAKRVGPDATDLVCHKDVDEDSWEEILQPGDCIYAERKLDRWLVKPTDGVFARMNRRVSIPISRRLIKYPITPNMVSLFTLGLSLVAGGFFAAGGYWNFVVGAVLGVVGSILDGCDGEIARLKLQASDLGCWLDTICDYLYYFVTFAGIIIGVTRSTSDPRMIGWGIAVFAGALLTFVSAGIGRKQISGSRPEQYLQVWQKSAERRSSGLLLRFARQTEFIVRRCFLPYLLLVIAVFNLMHVFVYMAAFGANVAWIVSLRSLIAFSAQSKSGAETARSSHLEGKPLIVKA